MTQSLLLQERQLESHGRHARPLRYAAAAHAVASPFALHVAIESLAPAVVLQHVVLQTPLAQSPGAAHATPSPNLLGLGHAPRVADQAVEHVSKVGVLLPYKHVDVPPHHPQDASATHAEHVVRDAHIDSRAGVGQTTFGSRQVTLPE